MTDEKRNMLHPILKNVICVLPDKGVYVVPPNAPP